MKIWSTSRPQYKVVATCSIVFCFNRKSVRIVHWVELSSPVLHPCYNAFLWNMFLCFIYDKRLWDNVKILTNDKVWQLLPLYPQGLLQKKAKLVWRDLCLTDLCWLLIISFIWLFPPSFSSPGMKLNWVVCNFLSSYFQPSDTSFRPHESSKHSKLMVQRLLPSPL